MYGKTVENGYIVNIFSGSSYGNITEQEYSEILAIIQAPRDEPPEGKAWALRADTLVYELVDAPEPEEDATEDDYKVALNAMGVSTHET